MKQTLLSLAVILFGLGSAYGQTTVDLEFNVIPSLDPEIAFFEVQLAFDVLPDSMGTGNEMDSGWENYDPNYTWTMLPLGTMTTEYYWNESYTNLSMYVTVICGEDTTILPPIDFESNTADDIVYAVSVDVGCGDGDIEWDCPDLMGNVGWGCQDGWGIIDENCDCVEYIEPENCLEFYLDTDSTLFDPEALLAYALLECGNQANLEPWVFCGLAESISAAMAGDEEACNEVYGWIGANNWDGTWDPGNGGNDFDCPELIGNIGDPCGINQGTFGVINEDCECVELEEPNACVADFTVEQAYNENAVIPFELFVFVWGYDESNTYSWDFGDEGTSSDPFPTWTYGGSGPYNLCLTVSNEEEDCVSTSCQMLEIDSLGWINGFMAGFSITIMNGEDGGVNGIDEQPANELGFNVSPNPVVNGSFGLNWEASSAGLVDITMLSMDGSVVVQTTRNRGETNDAQSINVAHLVPGLYFCQVRQNGFIRTEKVVIR